MSKKLFHGFEVLNPTPRPIKEKGKLRYHESTRSNSLIMLKKSIREAFLPIDGASNVDYQMEFYHFKEELKKRIDELEPGMMPILIFLLQETIK